MRNKKRTIYKNMLFPLILLLVLEGVLLYAFIWKTGIVSQLEAKTLHLAEEKLEARAHYLEDTMLAGRLNFESITERMNNLTKIFITQNQYSYKDICSTKEISENYLEYISGDVLSIMQTNPVSGVFFVCASGTQDANPSQIYRYNGIYFRGVGISDDKKEYSDVILKRGPVSVAKLHSISTDTNWEPDFLYNPLEEENLLDFFMSPLAAPYRYPNLAFDDLGFWNPPFYLNGKNRDASQIITYAVPLGDADKTVYGVIGIELSVDVILNNFKDAYNDKNGTQEYFLATYSETKDKVDEITCTIEMPLNTSYDYLAETGQTLQLAKGRPEADHYRIEDMKSDNQEVYGNLNHLSLFDSYGSFSEKQWAILSVSRADDLFFTNGRLIWNVAVAVIIALTFGSVVMLIVSSNMKKQILKISTKLTRIDMDDEMRLEEDSLRELRDLEGIIFDIREQYRVSKDNMQRETERYLVALESSADAVFEYDCMQDVFSMYRFEKEEGETAALKEIKLENFLRDLKSKQYCRKEDVSAMTNLLMGRYKNNIEVKMRSVKNDLLEWVSIRGRFLCDEYGKVRCVIGNIREINESKERDLQEEENNSRDKATKLFVREAGEKRLREYLSSKKSEEGLSVCVIDLDDFGKLNDQYGFLYGDIIIEEVGGVLRRYIYDDNIGVRLGGDEFLICMKNISKEETFRICNSICRNIATMYVGEEITQLTCSIGFVHRTGPVDYTNLVRYATSAMCAVKQHGKGKAEEYFDLQEGRDTGLGKMELEIDREINRIESIDYNDNIISVAFNIFEKSMNYKSALKILLKKTGREFGLSRILIVNANLEKHVDKIDEQWNMFGLKPLDEGSVYYEKEVQEQFLNLFEENNTFILNRNSYKNCPEALKNMLHFSNERTVLYCAIYNNGEYLGHIQFNEGNGDTAWSEKEINIFKELVKVISIHYVKNNILTDRQMQEERNSKRNMQVEQPLTEMFDLIQKMDELEEVSGETKEYIQKLTALKQEVLKFE